MTTTIQDFSVCKPAKKMSDIYVGNLNPEVSNQTIYDEFRQYSIVQESVRIVRKSPNYAFVVFNDYDEAIQAIRSLDGLHGWKVQLSHHSKAGGSKGSRGGVEESMICGKSWESNAKKKHNHSGDQVQEEFSEWLNRGNKSFRDGDQSKIGVNEGPPNQTCNHESIELEKPSVRGHREFKNGDQPKVNGDKGPFSQHCYQENVERKPFEAVNYSTSNQKTYKKNIPNAGYRKEAGHKWQNRENNTHLKVNVDEVPDSQQCIQKNADSNLIKPEQPSIDELASKLKSELEAKVRELKEISEENVNLKHKLNEENAEKTSAKAMHEEMSLKLNELGEQLEETNNRLTFSKVKGEDMILMLKKLKDELAKSKYNVSSAKAKESEMKLKVKKVQDEMEKVKSNASSAKRKEEEMNETLKNVEEKLRKSEKYAVMLNEKLKEVEGVKETLQAEMMNISKRTEELRKTADAAAEIFSMGVIINTEIEISESKPIFSYYREHAATKLSAQKVREYLLYLRIAATLDPTSLETHLLSAEGHLMLGEVEDALHFFSKCSKSEGIPCLNRRITIQAANGIKKSQKLVNCMKHSSELLQERTFSSATYALEVISEAMSISPSSEKLLEMQGEALFVLRKYEEAVKLCEKTLFLAEQNSAIVGVGNQTGNVYDKNLSRLWRWNLMSRSYFLLGKFEIALNYIEKQENLRSTKDNHGSRIKESMNPLAATIRELLHCKNAGNEAFQSGNHTEAVKNYTNALSRSTESRPFTAICLSNRAAAYDALNKITDGIADCNLALALDGNYQKALFRRAKLHEKIRDYEQSASDLNRLISVIEKQQSGKRASINQARVRLSCIEAKAKRRTTKDLYLILGVNVSDSASEIKKAYRRAALSHHPDKAGQFLTKSESGCDAQLWNDISKTISVDADKLFKIIGEAYSVLSDSRKKFKYDMEEKMRKEEEDEDNDENNDEEW